MKKNEISLWLVIGLFLIILTGCDDKVIEEAPKKETQANTNFVKAPNLSGVKPKIDSNARVAVEYQLLAFQGNDLYRVHPDTREVQFYGSDWGGTQAATVYNGKIYAVVANRLWEGNLTTGVVRDLGCCWDGTTFMTNDLKGSLYAIQYRWLLKINASNGSWSVMGPQKWDEDWEGSTEMGFGIFENCLYIPWRGVLYSVNASNGSYYEKGPADSLPIPFTVEAGSYDAPGLDYGIYQGKLVLVALIRGGIPGVNQSAIVEGDFSGASDISYTDFRISGGYWVSHVFILKDSQIHQVVKGTPPNTSSYHNLGPIPGLTNVYKIVSNQGL